MQNHNMPQQYQQESKRENTQKRREPERKRVKGGGGGGEEDGERTATGTKGRVMGRTERGSEREGGGEKVWE